MKRNFILFGVSGVILWASLIVFAQENAMNSDLQEEQLIMQIQQALINGDEPAAENLRTRLKEVRNATIEERQQEMQSMQNLVQDIKEDKLQERKNYSQEDFKSAMERYNEAEARNEKHQEQAIDQMKMVDELDHQQVKE